MSLHTASRRKRKVLRRRIAVDDGTRRECETSELREADACSKLRFQQRLYLMINENSCEKFVRTNLSMAVINGLTSVAEMPAAAMSPARSPGNLLVLHCSLKALFRSCCSIGELLSSYLALANKRS